VILMHQIASAFGLAMTGLLRCARNDGGSSQ
jgi:hypothetical protein